MIISKRVYWLLSLTWGLPLTLLGCLAAFLLKCIGKQPTKRLYGYYFKIGYGWGGFSLGPIAVVSENAGLHTLNHEFGHSIQNCFLGPLMPLMIAIPSMMRYWYREYLVKVKKKTYAELPPYDSAWFENSASEIGNFYFRCGIGTL